MPPNIEPIVEIKITDRITAISTAIYMILTIRIIFESRKARKLQDSPKLDIFVERAKEYWSRLNLIIKNNGYSWAYNIKLETDSNFNLFDKNDNDYTFKNLWFFKNWISFLPPNWERENILTYMDRNYKEKIKRKIEIKVTYNDKYLNNIENTFYIDLSEFENTILPQELPIYKIAKDIEDIRKNFWHIASWFTKLNIITQTKKEKVIEDKKYFSEAKKMLETLENK